MKVSIVLFSAVLCVPPAARAQEKTTLLIRGQSQTLFLYGDPKGEPVIVSSGDGGWVHLAPQVAEILSSKDYFVVGFDCKRYLSSFTTGKMTLSPADVPGDYLTVVDFASRGRTAKPIFVGVSEGAGLSVLAATDPAIKNAVRGLIGLGLPDVNELAWRWKDAIIYLTKQPPNEPRFHVSEIIEKAAGLPLALIYSTNDEFVPLTEARALFERALEPKKLWFVEASNHRFSGNETELEQRLMEAVDWVKVHSAPR